MRAARAMRVLHVHRQTAVLLLLASLVTLLMISNIDNNKPRDQVVLTGAKSASPTVRSTRAPVLRNAMPSQEEVIEQEMKIMLLSEDYVLEESEMGPGVWRASTWNDTQFEKADLALLRSIISWVWSPTGGCRRLEMMGRPRRSGNGLRPEQPVCRDGSSLGGENHSQCLVYLLGVGGDWMLAEQLGRAGCFVYVLDHREALEPEGQHSYHVRFRRLGVGRNAHVQQGGQVLTLDGLMRELGHQRLQLHFLRADLDGLETDMLLDQLVDRKSRYDRRCVLDRVEQLSLRLHLRSQVEKELVFYRQLWRALQQLELLGFELVHSTPFEAGGRWQFPGSDDPVVLMYDVLLVRKHPASKNFNPNMVA